jgi:hypothetical protein
MTPTEALRHPWLEAITKEEGEKEKEHVVDTSLLMDSIDALKNNEKAVEGQITSEMVAKKRSKAATEDCTIQ